MDPRIFPTVLIVLDVCAAGGMAKVKAWLVYTCVRAFGGSHYSNLDDDQGEIYNANRDRFIQFEWRSK